MNYRDDVKMIKALSDENRLAILDLLKNGEKCGCVILEELNITQPTLSHHMKILCASGIVDCRKDGKWMHYSISAKGSQKLKEVVQKHTICEEETQSCTKCDTCSK